MYVLTGTGSGFSAGRPKVQVRPIRDTRSFFSGGDVFSLGIAAGLAIVLIALITGRKATVPISKAARRYHSKRLEAARKEVSKHGRAVERHSRRIIRGLPRDVQAIGRPTKKSRRKRARLTAAADEDWLQSLGK